MENIGKFVLSSDVSYIFRRSLFYSVTGYDFCKKKYLVFDGYTYHALTNTDIKFYSYEEAINYIKTTIDKNIMLSSLLQKTYDSFRAEKDNSKNELKHLSSAYSESIKQKKFLETYAKQFKGYEYELKKTEKAIRRLNKRFYHYFGENAEEIQKMITTYGNIHQILELIKKISSENDKLNKLEKEMQLFNKKVKIEC